jgi:hypothetical protein
LKSNNEKETAMGKSVIVNAKDLVGDNSNGSLVYFNGEHFRVLNALYTDEHGDGIEIESIYSEKVINFEFEKVKKDFHSKK